MGPDGECIDADMSHKYITNMSTGLSCLICFVFALEKCTQRNGSCRMQCYVCTSNTMQLCWTFIYILKQTLQDHGLRDRNILSSLAKVERITFRPYLPTFSTTVAESPSFRSGDPIGFSSDADKIRDTFRSEKKFDHM